MFAAPVSCISGFGGGTFGRGHEPAPVYLLASVGLPQPVLEASSPSRRGGHRSRFDVVATITSALGIAVRKDADPVARAVGDARPLDYIEVHDSERAAVVKLVVPSARDRSGSAWRRWQGPVLSEERDGTSPLPGNTG